MVIGEAQPVSKETLYGKKGARVGERGELGTGLALESHE